MNVDDVRLVIQRLHKDVVDKERMHDQVPVHHQHTDDEILAGLAKEGTQKVPKVLQYTLEVSWSERCQVQHVEQ